MVGIPYTMVKKNNKPQPNKQRRPRQQRPQTQKYQMVSAPRDSALGSIGGQIGTVAGNFLSKIFGMGAYKLRKNSVYDDICNDQVPVMHSNSETVTFRHREYICDITSSTAFVSNSFSINPGLSATFPYLSAIAQNFQEYQFNGLVFEVKSTSANALNSTNTALGTVSMVAQYRADAPTLVNKQQLLNEMWAVDAKPSESFILPIECDPAENPLKIQYVRTGSLPTGQDIKLYDLAKVTVATVGSQAAAVVGELWATYEVVLRKPILSSGLALAGDTAVYSCATGLDGTHPLGIVNTQITDSIGLTISGSNTITLPAAAQGYFLFLQLISNGSGAAISFGNPTVAGGGATKVNINASSYFGSNGTGVGYGALAFVVYKPDPTITTTVTFANGTFPGSPAAGSVIVTQLDGDFVPY